ncbi:MAG: PQQ-dependent sugar dehydrogenase [Pyrinomonadaceae bacterium]
MRRVTTIAMLLLLLPIVTFGQSKLVPQKIALKGSRPFTLNLPSDYEIIAAAEGFRRPRFFAKSPDGRIFITDLYNLTDNKRGAIYILDGWDATSGRVTSVTQYLAKLQNPNSVQFYRDLSGQDWLYIAETAKLTRRKFTRGESVPSDRSPETIATFPDYGLSYKYGGWHLTRTIAFSPAGKLYVSVGSSCNACEEKEKVRATVLEMNPDGTGQRVFARGLRNAVGLRVVADEILATNQGSDHLGLSKPDETFHALRDGADYGWPYCHTSNGRVFRDPKFRRRSGCANVPRPYAYFPSRSSALGFDYFDESATDAALKNSFVVALHGSTDKALGHGYKIVGMRRGERARDLITGFLRGGSVYGRPCDILRLDANSFLFSDDHAGVIYLVRRKGSTPTIAKAELDFGLFRPLLSGMHVNFDRYLGNEFFARPQH